MSIRVALRAVALVGVLLACTPAALNGVATASPSPTATSLADSLRNGGLYIVMRHGASTGKDSASVDLPNCATQEALTDAGRSDLATMRADIAALHLPIGDVLASPYCRTLETARIVFGKATPTDSLAKPTPGTALPSDDPRVASLKRMLSTPPAAGTDTVLVTHSEIVRAIVGLDAVVGDSIIVRPNGSGGYTVVARIGVSGWKFP